jgi:putative transposase
MVEKKVRNIPMKARRSWISTEQPIPLARQCELAGTNRSTFYLKPKRYEPDTEELHLLELIDQEFTRHPFYGSRRMTHYLRRQGYRINRKRVQRLMLKLGLAGIMANPKTSEPHPEHKVFAYLLRGVQVSRPNQVWSADITYCRLPRGFMYLVAIVDWYSRKVLAWRLSNTMDSSFCVSCLQEAFSNYGRPEIFNTDQGSQFTSEAFIGAIRQYPDIRISMDGRGRALDNVFVERLWRSLKHEDLYLKGYSSGAELHQGLREYFRFYNTERLHQSLSYQTPDDVYNSASGGGARIVDKFVEMGQRHSAA